MDWRPGQSCSGGSEVGCNALTLSGAFQFSMDAHERLTVTGCRALKTKVCSSRLAKGRLAYSVRVGRIVHVVIDA